MVNVNYWPTAPRFVGKTQVVHIICIPNNVANCQKYKHIKRYTHDKNIDNKCYLFNSETIQKSNETHKAPII